MWTGEFWKATAELAVRGGAAAALLVLGADQFNALATDWEKVAGFALGGAVLSALFSLGSSAFGKPGTPTVVGK